MQADSPIANVADWQVVSLKQITTKIGSGATPRGGSETYLPVRHNFVLIRSQNVYDHQFDKHGLAFISNEQAFGLRNAAVQANDVLLNITGDGITFGRACLAPDDVRPACVNQHVSIVRVDPKLADAGYVLAFLTHPKVKPYIESFNSGGSRRAITKGHIESFKLPLPPVVEQHAIASVLGALDDKIEQNRRTVQTLEKLARAIFRAWFVDFEPVKAKAAGATNFPSMPQPVFDALPTTFIDSDIGPVPEGWEAGTIKDLTALSKAQVKPQESPEEIFDHFSIPAFDAGMRAVVEPGSAIKSNKFLVVDGCVLLSKLNPRIARVWLPPSACDRRQIASTEFLVFIPVEPSDRHYLYCQFQQREFREELAQEASGTSNSHQRVRPKDVLEHPCVMPAPSFRKAFANIADPLFALQLANSSESVKLAGMRDYLLPKLLSGEVRVRAAERHAAAVA